MFGRLFSVFVKLFQVWTFWALIMTLGFSMSALLWISLSSIQWALGMFLLLEASVLDPSANFNVLASTHCNKWKKIKHYYSLFHPADPPGVTYRISNPAWQLDGITQVRCQKGSLDNRFRVHDPSLHCPIANFVLKGSQQSVNRMYGKSNLANFKG